MARQYYCVPINKNSNHVKISDRSSSRKRKIRMSEETDSKRQHYMLHLVSILVHNQDNDYV